MQSRLLFALPLSITILIAQFGCTSDSGPTQHTARSNFIRAVVPTFSRHANGWLEWRGPKQNGVSLETNLPEDCSPDGPNLLWTYDLQGRGSVVTNGNRAYVMGYVGETDDLYEVLACLDTRTGNLIWQHKFRDFISDIIYNRYSIGAPSVDPETGNIYAQTSPGLLVCVSPGGRILWQISMMEQYGRLTFPNGRTGSPAIDGDLVIVNAITTNWGSEGPARNRFYAFNKLDGQLVWSSNPGIGPPYLKDSSFSTPVFEWRNGKRVFYATLGDGNVVCVNAKTGDPIWRYQFARGGVNSSVVLYKNSLIVVHGKENVGDSGRGRMVALRLDLSIPDGAPRPLALGTGAEIWRNDDISMFTSSPTLVDGNVYQCDIKGELHCVDAATGVTKWHLKLGADQLHASPLYADGKLYVPMWHDGFYIIKPHANRGEIIQNVELAGTCIGSPTVWNGQLYVHTTQKLYCFGKPDRTLAPPVRWELPRPSSRTGVASQVMVSPKEVLLRPGETLELDAKAVDQYGNDVDMPGQSTQWAKWIPPTAKVKVKLDATIDDSGTIKVGEDAKISAGAIRAVNGNISGSTRGRILPSPPYSENFESFALKAKDKAGTPFAFPPLPWIGARLKWDIREVDGNKVLAKTLDRILFMRSMIFMGHPDDTGYTIQADIMSDGNRRAMSSAGLINQRYIIMLDGNQQRLKIVSNYDRVDVDVRFKWKPGSWYTIKAAVEHNDDNTVRVLGKAWPRGEAEPDEWLITHVHEGGHRQGSPGIFGFSPQSKFRVYVDNISVTPTGK